MRFCTAAAALFVCSILHAQPAAAVMSQVPPAQMQKILQSLGYDLTEKPIDNTTIFYFKLAGYKVRLNSYPAFMELQLALSDHATPQLMNEWNRTHRFTRGYMDTDGGATLESALDYTGGVTQSAIEAFIKGFGETIPTFAKVVLDAANPSTIPSNGNTAAARANPVKDPPPVTSTAGPGVLTLLEGRMSVRYDPAKWTQKPSSDPTRFELNYAKGDGHAVVIPGKPGVSTDAIADAAFANIRKQDPTAHLVQKQKRRVGGVDVWFQVVEATVNRVPVTYYGYYYGGQAGTVQLLLFTARSLVNDYDHDFMDFLNGLRVSF